MNKKVKISQLIENKELNVGSKIGYMPNSCQYYPKIEETGVNYTSPIKTQNHNHWIVKSINYELKQIEIIPNDCLNKNRIVLKGILGFLGCPNVINVICCKLYSNATNGCLARSVNVRDISADYISPYSIEKRYAYNVEPVRGYEVVTFSGREYEKVYHNGGKERFYYFDHSSQVLYEKYGYPYAVPFAGNPVYVTERILSIKSVISCSENFFIPSIYVSKMAFNELAYNIRIVHPDGYVESMPMAYLSGKCGKVSAGIMPIVDVSFDSIVSCMSRKKVIGELGD